MTEIDHLDEDPNLVRHVWEDNEMVRKFGKVRDEQLWCCVSFLSPEGLKNCTVRGLKIRGVFKTWEEANEWAEILRDSDPFFDVFVGECGKWLPWDPDVNDIEDHRFKEKELNDLMSKHKEQMKKAKQLHKDRQKDMQQNSQQHQQFDESKRGQMRERLRKKLEQKKANEKMERLVDKQETNNNTNNKKRRRRKNKTTREQELEKVDEELKEQEELGKEEKERLQETSKNIKDQTEVVRDVNTSLARIQELYKKLNNN